ncbi:MAG: siphovirus ReqiPepy6 Gp37-like family protein [Clostridiales bacterium]|nr:siphovirus ReqiPepy6 Gp37-like family protein [Clostridiales bacterium]
MEKGGELFFLNEDFEPVEGPVEECSSAVWSERYFEPGSFTLKVPRALVKRVAGAKYVQSAEEDGGILCGRIDYLTADEAGEGEIGGRLLATLLEDRVIAEIPQMAADADAAETVLAVAEANLRGLGITVDRTNSVTIGASASPAVLWDNLGAWCYAALRPFGAAPEVKLREVGGTLVPVLRIVRGLDRSEEGSAARAVFSKSFGNILSVSLERDGSRMKNAVYVEGVDGTVVLTDKSGSAGRRETYKKAADVSPADFASDAAYRAALARRGEEILASRQETLCVSAESDTGALPVYGTDYALGDVCDVADEELGVSFAVRLTGVDLVWEGGGMMRIPFFGEEARLLRRLTDEERI